jgi:acid stress-induced BolA-like protein IbaG/YrbA
MGHHPTDFQGSVVDALRAAIVEAIPDAEAQIEGQGGHFTLSVVSSEFEGKSMVASHRLVLSAVAHLMKGDRAPVHAIDSLKTKAR